VLTSGQSAEAAFESQLAMGARGQAIAVWQNTNKSRWRAAAHVRRSE
jgi:hypothetical protein